MRLALTGATGFVGRNVVAAAVRRGFEVVAYTRKPEQPVHDCVETRLFSPDSPVDLSGCDAVVHLAGESVVGLWTPAKKRRVRDSRVEGTRALVNAIRAMDKPPEVLVSASAVGYYADGGDRELHEDAPPGDDFLAETCMEWEREALAAASVCRVARMRIGSVLGRKGGMLKALSPIFRMGLGGKLGSGRQWMPWIHVEDLASMLLFAVENLDARGPMNAVAPWPVRNVDFTRTFAGLLHRPAWFAVPGFMLRTLFGDFGRGMLASVRAVPSSAADLGFSFKFSEVAPALKDAIL